MVVDAGIDRGRYKMGVVEQLRKGTTNGESAILERLSSRHFARRVFILPATIVVLGLTIFPLLFSLGITFTDLRLGASSSVDFVGGANWRRLFTDNDFHTVMRNTIFFTIVGVTAQYWLGLGIALLLNQQVVGRRFFRVSFLLPMMMSPVAVSYMIGRTVFSESYGPINDILFQLGLPVLRWSLHPLRSMLILISINTWQWTPFFVLILLAGLQAIPGELYEAAKIDGASPWQLFWRITFPLLMPVSVTAILIRALEALKTIDIVRVVTGGGPGNATEVLTLFAYDIGIKGGDIAYGSTVAYALLIFAIVFALLFLTVTQRLTPES